MFVIIIFCLMSIFLSFLVLICNNMVVWWSVFLIMTIIFITLNKKLNSYSSLINYFIIQESLGLMFLLLSFFYFQIFIVLMKVGVAPLHFWIFSVTNGIYSLNLMWFLTFQKLPFLFVIMSIFLLNMIFILFLGFFICFLQMFISKNFKNMIILSSTESFNWIILGLFFSVLNIFYLFIYYLLSMVFLITNFSKENYNHVSWETTLVFMNIPFSVTFFVKIFSISNIFYYNGTLMLFVLFTMFLSALVFSYWLIYVSSLFMKENNKMTNTMFIIPLFFICIL